MSVFAAWLRFFIFYFCNDWNVWNIDLFYFILFYSRTVCVCPSGEWMVWRQTWLPTRVPRLRLVQEEVKQAGTLPTGQWHVGHCCFSNGSTCLIRVSSWKRSVSCYSVILCQNETLKCSAVAFLFLTIFVGLCLCFVEKRWIVSNNPKRVLALCNVLVV